MTKKNLPLPMRKLVERVDDVGQMGVLLTASSESIVYTAQSGGKKVAIPAHEPS